MISLAVRIRQNLPNPLWLSDVEVAALLGISRSTVWAWLDRGDFPPPTKRIGKARTSHGRERSCRTLWHRDDVELFARCRSMVEFKRLKCQREQG
jgi:predicted site-specific integrase-resolvase